MTLATHTIAQAAQWLAETEGEFDESIVTPGVGGFLAFAILGLGVIVLGFSLVRRLRRNQFRHEIREELEAELAERDAAQAAGEGDERA